MAHLTGDGGEVALVRFGESQGKTVQISKCFFCLFVNLTAVPFLLAQVNLFCRAVAPRLLSGPHWKAPWCAEGLFGHT